MKQLLLSAALLVIGFANAQVKIGDNPTSLNASSLLELESTTQGFLPPRMTNSQMTSIGSPGTPPAGMQVWCTDCGTSGELSVNNGTAWITFLPAPSTVTIGLHPELGGYVFYVAPNGIHGLVSETQYQGASDWYAAKEAISDLANHSLDGQNFTDWKLPTLNELTQMYNNSSLIGGFISLQYWSSMEGDYSGAITIDFNNGEQIYSAKGNVGMICAVRAF